MKAGHKQLMRDVRRRLVGRRAHEELLRFLAARLPRLDTPVSRAAWTRRAAQVRRDMLALLFRGHASGLLSARFPVERAGVAASGNGYRVRRLRYEGYPGMWVPALLYEPWPAARGAGKLPAVLNANGHHNGGNAMGYSQARCINLAKRGVLALNYEYIGMGELGASRLHTRIGHLDLVGIAGAGVFYLVMKRALDVLLSDERVDRKRVAMTGLSGGGWQTILLSSLDQRITASIPVAGHTAVWQRIYYPEDIGDMEQVPTDLCTLADFDVLSGMLAPRPSLFIYNHADDCCFPTRRARVSVIGPARRIFDLLGAADRIEWHDNVEPGTHNYEQDNRRRLYAFLRDVFDAQGADDDLPWVKELLTEEQCAVGLPPENATLLSLAHARAAELARNHAAARRRALTPQGLRTARRELTGILRLRRASVQSVRAVAAKRLGDLRLEHSVASIDGAWSVPLVQVRPQARAGAHGGAAGAPDSGWEGGAAPLFRGGEIVLAMSDEGRQDAIDSVMKRCCGAWDAPPPAHVAAADIYGTGELAATWQEHMVMASTGERPLGVQVGQILALARWLRGAAPGAPRRVSLDASGPVMSVAALLAVAVEPGLFGELVTDSLPASFKRLTEYPVDYEESAPLFCFGLFAGFDVPALLGMCGGTSVRDRTRGPLEAGGGPRHHRTQSIRPVMPAG